MPQEFVAKNGLIAKNNAQVTGSVRATAGFTGSLQGSASFSTSASYAISASYAPGSPSISASYAATASVLLGSIESASYALSASYAQVSCGINLNISGSTTITVGNKGSVFVPFTGVITGWSMVTGQTGSVVIDVQKSTFSTYPSFVSITNNTYVTSSNQVRASGSVNTWTSSLSSGDLLQFYVSSSNVTALNLVIYGVKYG